MPPREWARQHGIRPPIAISRSFERLEERIDGAESRLYSRLADVEDKVEAGRQAISDELGDIRDEIRQSENVK